YGGHRRQAARAGNAAGAAPLEWIVAAGVEHEGRSAGTAGLQPLDDSISREGGITYELFFPFAGRRPIRRPQVILAADLEAMAGEEEERHVPWLDHLVKGEERLAHAVARLILGDEYQEIQFAQHAGERARVIDGRLEGRNVLIS